MKINKVLLALLLRIKVSVGKYAEIFKKHWRRVNNPDPGFRNIKEDTKQI